MAPKRLQTNKESTPQLDRENRKDKVSPTGDRTRQIFSELKHMFSWLAEPSLETQMTSTGALEFRDQVCQRLEWKRRRQGLRLRD